LEPFFSEAIKESPLAREQISDDFLARGHRNAVEHAPFHNPISMIRRYCEILGSWPNEEAFLARMIEFCMHLRVRATRA
jgi:hypothetical protein